MAGGLSLFPKRPWILRPIVPAQTGQPCKHIAAVYYLLGEEFDRNPFLIFKLRGLERDELMTMLAGEAAPENSYQEDFETGIIASYEEETALSRTQKKVLGRKSATERSLSHRPQPKIQIIYGSLETSGRVSLLARRRIAS